MGTRMDAEQRERMFRQRVCRIVESGSHMRYMGSPNQILPSSFLYRVATLAGGMTMEVSSDTVSCIFDDPMRAQAKLIPCENGRLDFVLGGKEEIDAFATRFFDQIERFCLHGSLANAAIRAAFESETARMAQFQQSFTTKSQHAQN